MQYQGTYVLVGPPGTGKTHTLKKITEKVTAEYGFGDDHHAPVLICSLTRTAAKEIAGRTMLPRNAVATIHALAYRSQGSPPVFTDDVRDAWNEEHRIYRLSRERPTADDDLDVHGTEVGDELLRQYNFHRNRLDPEHQWPPDVRRFAKAFEAFKSRHDVTDYTDMLLGASESPPGDPKVIIVDEAQDTTPLALRVIRTWASHCEALFLVGDPWQALYTWAGADPGLLTDPTIVATHRGVLKHSYRVPAEVHAYATRWVRQLSDYSPIEYLPRRTVPDDKESPSVMGRVEYCEAKWNHPEYAVDRATQALEDGKKVMIMASTARMIYPTIQELKDHGIPYGNPWRPERKDWNPLTAGDPPTMLERLAALLRPLGNDRGIWTYEEFALWTEKLTGVLRRGARKELQLECKRAAGRPLTFEQLKSWLKEEVWDQLFQTTGDPQEALRFFHSQLEKKSRSAAEFPLRLAQDVISMPCDYSRDLYPPYIDLFVGTIHSFKGGEADVVIVYPDLSWAAHRAYVDDPKEADAIARAFYVAFTRARETLVLCEPGGNRTVEF